MKTQKVNFIALVALVIGIITMSFNLTNNPTTFHYTSNSVEEGAFADVSNWEIGPGTSCLPSGDKPCELNVEAQDKEELDAILQNLTNNQILLMVENFRN